MMGEVLGRTIPILAYHKVDRESPTRFWGSTESFDLQMKALQDLEFEPVSLHDLWQYCHGGPGLPARPVCITFDDGYENFAIRAFPILQKYGFTATVFLPTAFIGESSRYFNEWDRSPEERSFKAAHLLWSEVVELHRCGIEFGAHTRTHQDLEALFRSAPFDVEAEMAISKREIEEVLPMKAEFLSYPYKASGAGVEALARKAGFLGAVTVNGRAFDPLHGDWFRMDCIPVFSGGYKESSEDALSAFMARIDETLA